MPSSHSEQPGLATIVIWRWPSKRTAHMPLLVLLHGRGADEHDLIGLANRLPRGFAYASLRGFIAAEGGYTWFENRGAARPIAKSLRASVAALRAWLDRPDNSRFTRVYVCGFSAGMMMAGALVLDDPQRFAGAILLSGALALESAIAAPAGRLAGFACFYGRGAFDTVIPAPLIRETETYLRQHSGAELTLREYPHAHAISGREVDDIARWLDERG